MSEHRTEIGYPLALTRVHITGAAETEAAEGGRRLLVAANATVELHTAADPNDWLTLRMPDKAAADRAFTLKLIEDGRLATTDVTVTGRGGTVVKTLVSTVSTVAGVALGVLGRGGLGIAAYSDSADAKADAESWEGRNPELARYRTELQEAETAVHAALGHAYKDTASAANPADRRAALDRAGDFRRALDDMAKERAAVEAHRAAFLRGRADRRSQHHAFILDVEDLPKDEDVAMWPDDPDAMTAAIAGDSWAPLQALGVLVTRRDLTTLRHEQVPVVDGTAYEGVWYRRTRQVELRVHRLASAQVVVEKQPAAPGPVAARSPALAAAAPAAGTAGGSPEPPDPVQVAQELGRAGTQPQAGRTTLAVVPATAGNGPKPWLTLIDQREVHVVDDRCAYGYLPFHTAWFGEHTAALTFGPYGAPISLGSSATSALKEIAETVGSLPEQVLSGLETANKIVDQGEVAARQNADRRLADLHRRQSILEQELETSDLAATAGLRSELAMVKAEKGLLTGRRDLASVSRELALQQASGPMWQQAQLDEMANAVLRERVERMELEGKLRDMAADFAAAPLEFAKRVTALDEEIARLRITIEKIQKGEIPPAPVDDRGK